jgi:hypothetical protein
MTLVTQHITGQLNLKFVAAYFKAMHKERDIRVQRREDGSLYISDGMLAVNVPMSSDLFPFTVFADNWQRATFPHQVTIAQEGGPDIQSLFSSWGNTVNNHVLTITPFLLEIPGATNKSGTFSRKLTAYKLMQEDFSTYIPKRMMDMLNPDLDTLKGFLFETSGHERPVRVSAVNGIVAYLMPKCNIANYLKVQ